MEILVFCAVLLFIGAVGFLVSLLQAAYKGFETVQLAVNAAHGYVQSIIKSTEMTKKDATSYAFVSGTFFFITFVLAILNYSLAEPPSKLVFIVIFLSGFSAYFFSKVRMISYDAEEYYEPEVPDWPDDDEDYDSDNYEEDYDDRNSNKHENKYSQKEHQYDDDNNQRLSLRERYRRDRNSKLRSPHKLPAQIATKLMSEDAANHVATKLYANQNRVRAAIEYQRAIREQIAEQEIDRDLDIQFARQREIAGQIHRIERKINQRCIELQVSREIYLAMCLVRQTGVGYEHALEMVKMKESKRLDLAVDRWENRKSKENMKDYWEFKDKRQERKSKEWQDEEDK